MGAILGWIFRALVVAWPWIRQLLIWAGILTAQAVVMKTLWEHAFARMDSIVTGYSGGSVSFQPLALVNSFFPLSEMLSMLTGYMVLVGACATVRITKAFIDARKA